MSVRQPTHFQFGLLCVLVMLGLSAATNASTVAYWRMEGDGITTPSDGTFVQDTNGRTAIQAAGIPIIDVSGNGNTVYTWNNDGTGHQYRPDTPTSSLLSGDPNNWSIQNNGVNPASFTWSDQTAPSGTDVETITPSAWTIEASIKPTTVDNVHRTFVGREGNDVATSDARLAPLYFKYLPGGFLQIQYIDAAGNVHAVSDSIALVANQWYNVAAVSDGSTLRLYKDAIDGNGYVEVGTFADLTGSTNSAMIDPGTDINGDTWGWTLGRGRFGTSDDPGQNHTDRWFGFIDEVRISDSALAPSQFLFAASIPTPAALPAGLALMGLSLLRRRRA